MKRERKIFMFTLMAGVLLLTACQPEHMPEESGTVSIADTGSYETESAILNEAQLPDAFPLEFVFSSGAGAWRTTIVLNQDGSFNGAYLDSDMGDRGDDYPKGTQYICDFSGQFDNIKQIDGHTYSMTLYNIIAEKENGEEWIEDGILNKYSEPYGMEDGTEYLLYTPDTKIVEVPEEFLSWYPGWKFVDEDGNRSDTLSCYGIYNIKMGYGFFASYSPQDLAGTWRVDGEKTQKANERSLQEEFGTGIQYGSEMVLSEDGGFSYYIAINRGGEGKWAMEEGVITADFTTYEPEVRKEQLVMAPVTGEDGELLIKMTDTDGYILFWSRV